MSSHASSRVYVQLMQSEERNAGRAWLLGVGVLIVTAGAMGCQGSGDPSRHTRTSDRPASQPAGVLALTGIGITGARVDAPARVAQEAATKALGEPDGKRFSGCELGGPGAIYGEVLWSWGAFDLSFSNRATTRKVVPGRFLGWEVDTNGALPTRVRLPPGITRRSSAADVRAATPVLSAGEGLPGVYEIQGVDGITYAFQKPYRRVRVIALNPPRCE